MYAGPLAEYHKAGLAIVRNGRILLCRKRSGTRLLILPGGCIEPGESASECLRRELREELGDVAAEGVEYLGQYVDQAAGDPSKTVRIELFHGELKGDPAPHAEIEELVWFGEGDERSQLAPSLANLILPDLVARGVLRWGEVELLAPARDLECGLAAIDCGADAVYIGAPKFGAREAASASLESIGALAKRAHLYWAKVYAVLNTLLFDGEMEEAVRLAWDLYEAGVDALIIQDAGLIECELPPLPLIASTQMHNHTPQRVAFLESVGFRRAILARELDLDGIRAIRRAAPRIELECFVHGALCVSYSGQCYLSYALGGRSGNRGQCAQPCRRTYKVMDSSGREIDCGRHPLSLKDLHLSESLPELLDAGVRSFKIEGRLKDRNYVANIVAHYRARLDEEIAKRGLHRASSGASEPGFAPDVSKTFNRGYTAYFLHGRGETMGSRATPKMLGERIGTVAAVQPGAFTTQEETALRPGDGVCYFDAAGELQGAGINAVDGRTIVPERMDGLTPGAALYRNHDREFLAKIESSRPARCIGVRFALRGGTLEAQDEDGVRALAPVPPAPPADKPDRARENIRRQLSKTGDTAFRCREVEMEGPPPFLPLSALNALRREALARLEAARERSRPRIEGAIAPNDAPFPEAKLSYAGNVLNQRAEAFYRRHGVTHIEPGAESGVDLRERPVMTTRYCLLEEIGLCPVQGGSGEAEPLTLVDEDGVRLELHFDCGRCGMTVILR